MSRTEETREEKHISIATIVLLDQPMIYDESLRLMSLRIVLNTSLSQGKHRNWVQKILVSFESDKLEKNWQNECESCSVAQFSETSTLTQADAEIGVVWSK